MKVRIALSHCMAVINLVARPVFRVTDCAVSLHAADKLRIQKAA
jgi:hypothetical protein